MTATKNKKSTSALAIAKTPALTAPMTSMLTGTTGFGMDMSYNAIDTNCDASEMKVPSTTAKNVVAALTKLAGEGEKPCVVSKNFWNLHLKFEVSGDSPRVSSDGVVADDVGTFKIWVTTLTGLKTALQVRVKTDVHGKSWVNVSGNATSLVLGYNAFAPAMADASSGVVLRSLFRLPWGVLCAVMRVAGETFQLDDKTKARIDQLDFRLSTHQVFTYMPVDCPVAELVGFLRSIMSIPFSKDGRAFSHLGRPLGVHVVPNPHADTETGILIFVNEPGEKRRHLSLNLYDKQVKARRDLDGKGMSDDATTFLRHHVRLDVSMSQGALRKFVKASDPALGRESDTVTAAMFCKASVAFAKKAEAGGTSAVEWLVGHVFEKCLRLRALLRFSPSRLAKALAEVETADRVGGRLMRAWAAQGFVGRRGTKKMTCRTFLMKVGVDGKDGKAVTVSKRKAKAAIKLMRRHDIDVDLPLELCNVFYAQTFSWAMSEKDRSTYAAALEKGDRKVVSGLQKASRAKTVAATTGLVKTLKAAPKKAHVPTIEITMPPKSIGIAPKVQPKGPAKKPK